MKRFVLVLTTVALVVAVCSVGVSGAAPVRIELCHAPGTPDEATLSIPEGAAAPHLAHGDLLGPCGEPPPPPPPLPSVLNEVLTRGHLRCGVSEDDVSGFSTYDEVTDTWDGMDVDLCRAVAAAVFGTEDAVVFVPLLFSERFPALHAGLVDVVFDITTDTLTRDATFNRGGQGVNFGPTYFHDGANILVWHAGPFGALSICSVLGTTVHESLLDLIPTLGFPVTVVVFADFNEAVGAFNSGLCDGIAWYQSMLIGVQQQGIDLGIGGAESWAFLLEAPFSEEPLAPVVRDGDDEWMAIVRWTVYATFLAEEMGVTSANVNALGGIGDAGALGPYLGLGLDWDSDIIREVGNYGEIYVLNLGSLERGLNAQWVDGGLLYAPPFR